MEIKINVTAKEIVALVLSIRGAAETAQSDISIKNFHEFFPE